MKPATPDRFWSKVDQSGGMFACWPWMAYRDRWGYGEFALDGKMAVAHRVALALVGRPLGPDELALHDCDNPACCNPAHLRPGTHAENMADRTKRGRSGHARPHLSPADVARLRASVSPADRRRIASELGISDRHARYVVIGTKWANVA